MYTGKRPWSKRKVESRQFWERIFMPDMTHSKQFFSERKELKELTLEDIVWEVFFCLLTTVIPFYLKGVGVGGVHHIITISGRVAIGCI